MYIFANVHIKHMCLCWLGPFLGSLRSSVHVHLIRHPGQKSDPTSTPVKALECSRIANGQRPYIIMGAPIGTESLKCNYDLLTGFLSVWPDKACSGCGVDKQAEGLRQTTSNFVPGNFLHTFVFWTDRFFEEGLSVVLATSFTYLWLGMVVCCPLSVCLLICCSQSNGQMENAVFAGGPKRGIEGVDRVVGDTGTRYEPHKPRSLHLVVARL